MICAYCGSCNTKSDWSENIECGSCGARYNERVRREREAAKRRDETERRTGKRPPNEQKRKYV